MACRKLISCSNDFHFSHPPPIWLLANQKGTDSLSYLAKDIFHGLGMSVKNPTGWAHGLLMTWDEMKTDRQRRISQSKGIVERRNGKTRYEGGEGLCHLHPLSITVIVVLLIYDICRHHLNLQWLLNWRRRRRGGDTKVFLLWWDGRWWEDGNVDENGEVSYLFSLIQHKSNTSGDVVTQDYKALTRNGG